MRISKLSNENYPQFKAFQLTHAESKLVNNLLKEYIDYAKINARDEIFYIYDNYLVKEAATRAKEVFSTKDYLQSLRLNLLKGIENYKALPKMFKPETFLTKKLNKIKPSTEDKTLFDNKDILPSNALNRKDYQKLMSVGETLSFEI